MAFGFSKSFDIAAGCTVAFNDLGGIGLNGRFLAEEKDLTCFESETVDLAELAHACIVIGAVDHAFKGFKSFHFAPEVLTGIDYWFIFRYGPDLFSFLGIACNIAGFTNILNMIG